MHYFFILFCSNVIKFPDNFQNFSTIYYCYNSFSFIKKLKKSNFNYFVDFFGAIFDIITGTILGMHSIFFFLIKFFLDVYEIKFKISKKMGEWILFSIVYFSSLLVSKLVFILVTFKIPDMFSVIFNLGSTLLIFPFIRFLINLPKFFFNLVGK